MNQIRLKISIVMTNYNYARYIGFAIDSVLAQTRAADEIIIVDDGSTDRSREIISSYGDKVRQIFKSNEGHKIARNLGFQVSTGDVVLFFDADDVLYARALEMVESHWRTDAAKVQFDLDVIDAEGKKLNRRFCNFRGDLSPLDLKREFGRTGTYMWPVTSGNAYARSFLEKVMPLTPPVSHDGVLNTIAPVYGSVITIGQAQGQYRLHGRNISRTNAAGHHKRFPDFSGRIASRLQEFAVLREHASKFGVHLPVGNYLDNELVFVNYRLMAMKLGQAYEGIAFDTAPKLWHRGVQLALQADTNFRTKLVNLTWFSALLIAPGVLANVLILLRFNRAEVVRHLMWPFARAKRSGGLF